MAATYPLAVRTFTQKRNLFDDVEASHINDIQDEIEALETALGDMPHVDNVNKVTYPSVAARLDAMSKTSGPACWDLYEPQVKTFPGRFGADLEKWQDVVALNKVNDTDGLYDGVGITIKKPGWYHINSGALFGPAAISGARHLVIKHVFAAGGFRMAIDSSYPMTTGSVNYSNGGLDAVYTNHFNKGDRIQIAVGLDTWGGRGNFTVQSVHMQGFLVRGD